MPPSQRRRLPMGLMGLPEVGEVEKGLKGRKFLTHGWCVFGFLDSRIKWKYLKSGCIFVYIYIQWYDGIFMMTCCGKWWGTGVTMVGNINRNMICIHISYNDYIYYMYCTCFLQTNLFPDIHMYWLMVTTSDGWVDWLFFTSLCLSADAAVVAFDRVPRLKRTLSLRRVWGSGHHQSMKSPGKSLGKFQQRHICLIEIMYWKRQAFKASFFVSSFQEWKADPSMQQFGNQDLFFPLSLCVSSVCWKSIAAFCWLGVLKPPQRLSVGFHRKKIQNSDELLRTWVYWMLMEHLFQ